VNYRLARHVELVHNEGGHFLISRRPLTLLRLNRSLSELIERGLSQPLERLAPATRDLLERLCSRGFLEALPTTPAEAGRLPLVSVIVPVKDRALELRRCLDSISLVSYPKERIEVIVVDDGSGDDSAAVGARSGALLVPSGGTGRGPAAARNAGARRARGEILAFIDSDCTASVEWLADLMPAFADRRTAAVGGLVRGMSTRSPVDRYEAVMSSLSLGPRERSAGAGADTFYLPSCNLLVRRQAFSELGGFNEEMQVGEDVDLSWRLRDRGWRICYHPRGKVRHEHRNRLASFMRRRFEYGTSEGALQRKHPLRRKQMLLPPVPAALLLLFAWSPFAGGWPLLAASGLLCADAFLVGKKAGKSGLTPGYLPVAAARLRASMTLFYYLCQHLVRYYLPALFLLSILFPVMAAVSALALGCASAVDYLVRKPRLGFPLFLALSLAEQLAYGAGVFWGSIVSRSFASYRIACTSQMEPAA
jgi:mycofactocin system glycosyltransferase